MRTCALLIAAAVTLPLAVPANTFAQARPLASWIDDAKTLKPGTGNIGFSFERWQSPTGAETDAPVLDLSVGVTKVLQLEAIVPDYRASYTNGFKGSGIGDSYLVAKVCLVDPETHRVGLAVSPLLEILKDAELLSPTRQLGLVHWSLPVIVEIEGDPARTYITAGYSSRGAVFVTGAVEGDLSSKVTLSGGLYLTHTTGAIATTNTVLNPSRTDAEGTVYIQATPKFLVYLSVGRTLSKVDSSGATLIVSSGFSVNFGKRKHTP